MMRRSSGSLQASQVVVIFFCPTCPKKKESMFRRYQQFAKNDECIDTNKALREALGYLELEEMKALRVEHAERARFVHAPAVFHAALYRILTRVFEMAPRGYDMINILDVDGISEAEAEDEDTAMLFAEITFSRDDSYILAPDGAILPVVDYARVESFLQRSPQLFERVVRIADAPTVDLKLTYDEPSDEIVLVE